MQYSVNWFWNILAMFLEQFIHIPHDLPVFQFLFDCLRVNMRQISEYETNNKMIASILKNIILNH